MADHQHNDPLEEFFKKKVREYDITYNEEDWNKLEKRLEASDKSLIRQRIRYVAAAAVALLFSILAYVTYQQQMTINDLNERLTSNQTLPEYPELFTDVLPQNLFDFSPSPQPDETNESASEQNKVRNEETTPSEESGSHESENTQLLTIWNHNQVLENAALRERDLWVSDQVFSATITNEISAPALKNNGPSGFTPANTLDPYNEERSSYQAQQSFPTQNTSQLTVGLLGGPDLSTVGGFSEFYDPGYKMGLAVEYAITENLAISVGAIHSKVQYSASGSKYNPPQDYWSYGIIPDETVGVCFLIDIPMNLKYDFLHFEHSRIFATAGASSYIMLNEEYQFEYDTYSAGQQDRWQERTGSSHWMSNATFSLGYELDLNQKISLRAEPFIKVPMREVGWGNVKLYSMGSLLSINYNVF